MDSEQKTRQEYRIALAGNPNSGKTTMALQVALENAKAGIPVHVFLAESEEIEAQLSFLSMDGAIRASFANKLRYDPAMRTESHLAEIREKWDELIAKLPIYVYSVQGANMDTVLEMAGPIQDSIVIIDHIYAFVWQGENQNQAYANFARGFSGTRQIAFNGNNVVVVFNQYTKGEQTDNNAWRNPESGFGGAAQLNMSATKLNLYADPALRTPGSIGVMTKVVKTKAMLVVDDRGVPVNPNGQETIHYIDLKYRKIVEGPGVSYG